MNDKELAEKVAAIGVGEKYRDTSLYWIGEKYGDYERTMNEHAFVRDWRVAGALMEMLADESLPRDVIEHCVTGWEESE